MTRDMMGDSSYWDGRVVAEIKSIANSLERLKVPAENSQYEPQYLFNLAEKYFRIMLLKYSRGDEVDGSMEYFSGLLESWERSNEESVKLCRENGVERCRDWIFELCNLNHYNWCFRLVGLALALNINDKDWRRLLNLISGEGEDVLLDRIIASREHQRPIGMNLLHEKPYSRLLKCIDSSSELQPHLLKNFVENWYRELKRPSPNNRKSPPDEPYWYVFGDPEKNPLSMGSYFGRWCIEAVAAVKAFDLDDYLCLGHEHYPGDLLRPLGPSTHPKREDPNKNWFAKFFSQR